MVQREPDVHITSFAWWIVAPPNGTAIWAVSVVRD